MINANKDTPNVYIIRTGAQCIVCHASLRIGIGLLIYGLIKNILNSSAGSTACAITFIMVAIITAQTNIINAYKKLMKDILFLLYIAMYTADITCNP